MPKVLHARWLLPIIAVVGAIALFQNVRALSFRAVAPGLEFATLRGDRWCRRGSGAVAVLRIDPAQARIRVRHFSQFERATPPTVVEWKRMTSALAVFNAGQYYPDLSYMGLLVSGGRAISSRLHPEFKAALVAGPSRGGPEARVLDLEQHPLDARNPGWEEVAQSFMLFDSTGQARVRRSDRVAPRTAVAEDSRGRMVVVVSEGAYTLADFATLLRQSALQLTHAMSMDGGLESELIIATRSFRYASFGAWSEDREPVAMGARVPLPAVITVEAR